MPSPKAPARRFAAAAHLALAFAVVFATLVIGTLTSGCPGTVSPGGGACSDEQECAAGLVCQDEVCVARCREGSCERGICETSSGACVECLDTTDCPGGFVCNGFANRCVQPLTGCTSDDDCGGQRCDTLKGSCVQCLRDGDCPLGEVCDLLSNTCGLEKACVTDGDCTDTVCHPQTRICVECFNNAHCGSGTCNLPTSTCVSGCSDDDPTEPNDGENAAVIESGGAHEGTICPGDVDELVIVAEGTLTATLTIDGAAGLQLRLLSGGGTLIATGTPAGAGLTLTASSLAAGAYRLVVNGATSTSSGDYLLTVQVTPPAGCVQLDPEPNDVLGQATVIVADNSLRSGAICGNDTDLWRFTAASGEDIEATAVPGDGAGALQLSILDAAGNVVTSGNPATVQDVSAGTFFVRVTATGGDVTYSLRVQATAGPPACNQTDAEPNDADAQALALSPGTPASGTICPGDVDQFRFAAAALDDVAITVTGAGLQARLIRAADGVQLASGLTMNVANLQAGGYRIVVQGATAQSQSSYTIQVQLTPEPVADPCLEGGLEPDSRAAPRQLALDGTPLAGRICANDTDFFRFTLPFRSTVTVRARFTHASGDLDLRLVDSGGATLASSAGVTNDEIIVRTLEAGTYGAEIFGFLGAVNTYTIEATLQGCVPDDGFEDNNDISRATPIGSAIVSAARCPGDDDFFLIRLEAGDVLDASLAGAGLTMSLVSSTNGALLASDAPNGANRRLQASGLPAGRYGIRITGSGADRVPYSLTPTITPTPARCVDDGATPNETAAAAFALSDLGLQDGSYEVGRLVMCRFLDQDWFRIPLPGQKKVAVQLAFDPSRDVDLELLEPRGSTGLTRSLARSFAATAQDRVEGVLNAGGNYLIKAIGFDDTLTRYGIGIELSDPPPSSCVDDRFDTFTATLTSTTTESFNNDAATRAVELSSGESLPRLRVCPGNDDWYKINANAGQRIVIRVDYAHAAGRDIDVRLFNSQSQTEPDQVAQSVGTSGTENISFTVVSSGTHFIKVFGFQNGENVYDLTVSVN
jgi:Cys-rich repeat protein